MSPSLILRRSAIVLTAAVLAACGGEEAEEVPVAEVVSEPAGGMQDMEGMEGMGGMMGGGMMNQMQAHMQMMEGASGDSLQSMLAMHRQMTANMIAQMNREMGEMNMAADDEWNSAIDALREDLVQMPGMSAAELEAFMPAHRERMMRLMEMHRSMMDGMNTSMEAPSAAPVVTVYKTPTCGCCTKWVDHLRENGFAAETVDQANLSPVKREHGVPAALESCHTAVVDGYIVEGHVPADVIRKLLTERPAVQGIGVPGMPMGSPGMEGPYSEPYEVFTFTGNGPGDVYAIR